MHSNPVTPREQWRRREEVKRCCQMWDAHCWNRGRRGLRGCQRSRREGFWHRWLRDGTVARVSWPYVAPKWGVQGGDVPPLQHRDCFGCGWMEEFQDGGTTGVCVWMRSLNCCVPWRWCYCSAVLKEITDFYITKAHFQALHKTLSMFKGSSFQRMWTRAAISLYFSTFESIISAKVQYSSS